MDGDVEDIKVGIGEWKKGGLGAKVAVGKGEDEIAGSHGRGSSDLVYIKQEGCRARSDPFHPRRIKKQTILPE